MHWNLGLLQSLGFYFSKKQPVVRYGPGRGPGRMVPLGWLVCMLLVVLLLSLIKISKVFWDHSPQQKASTETDMLTIGGGCKYLSFHPYLEK